MALTRDVFGPEFRNNLLEMNASDERKLESIRTKVKQFARTSPYGDAKFKIINASETFINNLRNVDNPEKKRKIIGLNMVFCLNMFEILVSKTFILKQDCFGAWPN